MEGLGRAPGRPNRRCPLAAAAHVAPAAWPRDQHHPSLGGLMPAVSQGGDPDISRKFDRSLSTLCGGQPHLGCVVGDASLDGYVTTPVPPGRSQRSRPTWYRKLKLSPRMTTVDAIGLSAKPRHGVPVMGCTSWSARYGVIATFSTPSRWRPNRSYAASISPSLNRCVTIGRRSTRSDAMTDIDRTVLPG